MLLQTGDKGIEVGEVQKLLSMIGYDLIIDGDYGIRTTRSVKAFQKKYRLDVDGIVGTKTYQALKAAQKRTSKEERGLGLPKTYGELRVDTSVPLQEGQYIKQRHDKSQIFIHFTSGSRNAGSVIKYWGSNEPRIATAYVIGGDGRIHEAFNPDFWSFHLGIKGSKGKLDRISIGIELCAYGPLKKKGNRFYAWPEDYNTEVPADEVVELDEEFRGFKYFHSYTNEQIESLEKLLDYLIIEYDIEVQDSFDNNWFEYNEELVKKRLPGVWTHTNVRTDKTDSYPDDRVIEVLNRIGNNG